MARHGVEHRVEPRFDHDLRQTGETKTHARDPDPKIPFTRESVNGGGGMVVVVVGWWWWWWRGRARSGACRAPDHVGSPPHLLAFLPTLPIDPPPPPPPPPLPRPLSPTTVTLPLPLPLPLPCTSQPHPCSNPNSRSKEEQEREGSSSGSQTKFFEEREKNGRLIRSFLSFFLSFDQIFGKLIIFVNHRAMK